MQIKKLLKRNYVTVDHGKKEVVKVVATPFRWLSRIWCKHEADCLSKLAELGFANAPKLISSTANTFTMQKIEGTSLRGRKDIAEQLFLRIMAVIRQLHGFGFAHGNLRPNNIFITRENEPFLIDFETCCRKHSPLFFLARFRDHVRLYWLWQSRVVQSNPELVRAGFPRYVVWAMFVITPFSRFGCVVSSVRKKTKKFFKSLAASPAARAGDDRSGTRAAGGEGVEGKLPASAPDRGGEGGGGGDPQDPAAPKPRSARAPW